MTQNTKCVETIVVVIAATIIVLTNRDMFFIFLDKTTSIEVQFCYVKDNSVLWFRKNSF